MSGAPHLKTGARGEAVVAGLLLARGMTLLGRNLRLPSGEIDLLAVDADGAGWLVEVKTSRRRDAALPRIDARKAARLFALAEEAAHAYALDRIAVWVAAVHLDAASEQVRLHQLEPW